jgi:transposase
MCPITPKKAHKRREWTTRTRTRFFDAYNAKTDEDSLRAIGKRLHPDLQPSTTRRWLNDREKYGDEAYHRTRKLSKSLGPKYKLCEGILDQILDRRQQLHDMKPQAIIDRLNLHCTTRTLGDNLRARKHALRVKKRKTKAISKKNKKWRVDWGNKHRNLTIHKYWQWCYFTDESHFDAEELSYKAEYDYIMAGERDQQQLQETTSADYKGKVHVAGGVSYNGKGFFGFYHDPAEPEEDITKLRKPVYRMHETNEAYQERLNNWKIQKFDEQSQKPRGNNMTMNFYCDHILSGHINFIKKLEHRYRRQKRRVGFVEDGDPSHGKKTQSNRAYRMKKRAGILCEEHPAQSPDLNPIEGIWNIIKQRLRGHTWPNRQAFKDAIYAEWRRVTIDQIRRRISEMPYRCKLMVLLGGNRYRSSRW